MEQKNKQLTLGSLFDGSGGFPLAGKLAGIKPVWAADVEPFCIAVTRKNLPEMKHYGDVSVISGAELEPVDIITWGSPCQGLSVAGKRKGLQDERSGLYVEAVRIVKEMLEATDGEYPKFCVFENVPGLLSSADGKDFITCLDMMQELGFLPDANILDAQFMGVPQRRKRVFITWVQVDYILRKRTPISDSITLQLLIEILQINLAGLLRAYGIGLKKSASKSVFAGDGLKRRMNLFSLQREDRLQMLQRRLEEIKATPSSGQSSSDSNRGGGRTEETISTVEDTKSEGSTTGNQSWSIGQLLKSALEDGLQIESGSTTSTWTKETISRKICTCFQAFLNTLDVTANLMHSLEKEPMSLNCFEWAQYVLTETREFIDETKKYERSTGQVVWHDHIWYFEQELQTKGEQIEQYLTEVCGCEVLPESESLPWNSPKGIRPGQGTAGDSPQSPGEAGSSEGRVVLNDQGGSRIDVGCDIASTLRAETHGHPPCVMEGAAGFCTEHSAKSRSIGYEEEKSPTLRAGVVPAAVQMYENHSQDTRYTGPLDVAPTVNATYGMGGNNQPFVTEEEAVPITMKIRCGGGSGGKGQLCQRDKSATLACNNDQTLFVPEKESCYWDGGQTAGTLTNRNAGGAQRMPDKDNFNCVLESGEQQSVEPQQTAFGISSFQSHAMLSDNPRAGIYEAETSRTLDVGGGSPSCNQGGVCVVEKCYDIRQTSDGTKVSRHHCYETDTARSLGTTFPDPAGNHGGVAVVEQEPLAFTQNQRNEVRDLGDKSGALQAEPGMKHQTFVLQGNMIGRDDKNGPQGCGVSEDVCYTLTDVDRHAVAVPDAAEVADPVYAMTTGGFTQVEKELSPTLMARDYKDPTTVAPLPLDEPEPHKTVSGKEVFGTLSASMGSKQWLGNQEAFSGDYHIMEPHYTVRRLTPTECARLQGFYDWWTDGLGNPDPTDEEVAFWMDVWETHRKVVSHASKPKTENQIRKWLADPYSDSAAYKLWGNGVALPCVYFIMQGIVWAAGKK